MRLLKISLTIASLFVAHNVLAETVSTETSQEQREVLINVDSNPNGNFTASDLNFGGHGDFNKDEKHHQHDGNGGQQGHHEHGPKGPNHDPCPPGEEHHGHNGGHHDGHNGGQHHPHRPPHHDHDHNGNQGNNNGHRGNWTEDRMILVRCGHGGVATEFCPVQGMITGFKLSRDESGGRCVPGTFGHSGESVWVSKRCVASFWVWESIQHPGN